MNASAELALLRVCEHLAATRFKHLLQDAIKTVLRKECRRVGSYEFVTYDPAKGATFIIQLHADEALNVRRATITHVGWLAEPNQACNGLGDYVETLHF